MGAKLQKKVEKAKKTTGGWCGVGESQLGPKKLTNLKNEKTLHYQHELANEVKLICVFEVLCKQYFECP